MKHYAVVYMQELGELFGWGVVNKKGKVLRVYDKIESALQCKERFDRMWP